MAKIKVYMRVGKTDRGYKVSATAKPNSSPLDDGAYRPKAVPTVFFAVDFEIDDSEFNLSEKTIGTVSVKSKKSQIKATEYEEPELPEFDENCLPDCKPGEHKCGK